MRVDRKNLERVLDAFEQGDWDEIRLRTDDFELHLTASGSTADTGSPILEEGALVGQVPADSPDAVTASVRPAPGVTETTADPVITVDAPSLGIFWRAPSPGAPPFVDVGQPVGPETTTCIVEVMKLMNHVPAGCAGTVVAVLVGNGEQVERGQPLFRVAPGAGGATGAGGA